MSLMQALIAARGDKLLGARKPPKNKGPVHAAEYPARDGVRDTGEYSVLPSGMPVKYIGLEQKRDLPTIERVMSQYDQKAKADKLDDPRFREAVKYTAQRVLDWHYRNNVGVDDPQLTDKVLQSALVFQKIAAKQGRQAALRSPEPRIKGVSREVAAKAARQEDPLERLRAFAESPWWETTEFGLGGFWNRAMTATALGSMEKESFLGPVGDLADLTVNLVREAFKLPSYGVTEALKMALGPKNGAEAGKYTDFVIRDVLAYFNPVSAAAGLVQLFNSPIAAGVALGDSFKMTFSRDTPPLERFKGAVMVALTAWGAYHAGKSVRNSVLQRRAARNLAAAARALAEEPESARAAAQQVAAEVDAAVEAARAGTVPEGTPEAALQGRGAGGQEAPATPETPVAAAEAPRVAAAESTPETPPVATAESAPETPAATPESAPERVLPDSVDPEAVAVATRAAKEAEAESVQTGRAEPPQPETPAQPEGSKRTVGQWFNRQRKKATKAGDEERATLRQQAESLAHRVHDEWEALKASWRDPAQMTDAELRAEQNRLNLQIANLRRQAPKGRAKLVETDGVVLAKLKDLGDRWSRLERERAARAGREPRSQPKAAKFDKNEQAVASEWARKRKGRLSQQRRDEQTQLVQDKEQQRQSELDRKAQQKLEQKRQAELLKAAREQAKREQKRQAEREKLQRAADAEREKLALYGEDDPPAALEKAQRRQEEISARLRQIAEEQKTAKGKRRAELEGERQKLGVEAMNLGARIDKLRGAMEPHNKLLDIERRLRELDAEDAADRPPTSEDQTKLSDFEDPVSEDPAPQQAARQEPEPTRSPEPQPEPSPQPQSEPSPRPQPETRPVQAPERAASPVDEHVRKEGRRAAEARVVGRRVVLDDETISALEERARRDIDNVHQDPSLPARVKARRIRDIARRYHEQARALGEHVREVEGDLTPEEEAAARVGAVTLRGLVPDHDAYVLRDGTILVTASPNEIPIRDAEAFAAEHGRPPEPGETAAAAASQVMVHGAGGTSAPLLWVVKAIPDAPAHAIVHELLHIAETLGIGTPEQWAAALRKFGSHDAFAEAFARGEGVFAKPGTIYAKLRDAVASIRDFFFDKDAWMVRRLKKGIEQWDAPKDGGAPGGEVYASKKRPAEQTQEPPPTKEPDEAFAAAIEQFLRDQDDNPFAKETLNATREDLAKAETIPDAQLEAMGDEMLKRIDGSAGWEQTDPGAMPDGPTMNKLTGAWHALISDVVTGKRILSAQEMLALIKHVRRMQEWTLRTKRYTKEGRGALNNEQWNKLAEHAADSMVALSIIRGNYGRGLRVFGHDRPWNRAYAADIDQRVSRTLALMRLAKGRYTPTDLFKVMEAGEKAKKAMDEIVDVRRRIHELQAQGDEKATAAAEGARPDEYLHVGMEVLWEAYGQDLERFDLRSTRQGRNIKTRIQRQEAAEARARVDAEKVAAAEARAIANSPEARRQRWAREALDPEEAWRNNAPVSMLRVRPDRWRVLDEEGRSLRFQFSRRLLASAYNRYMDAFLGKKGESDATLMGSLGRQASLFAAALGEVAGGAIDALTRRGTPKIKDLQEVVFGGGDQRVSLINTADLLVEAFGEMGVDDSGAPIMDVASGYVKAARALKDDLQKAERLLVGEDGGGGLLGEQRRQIANKAEALRAEAQKLKGKPREAKLREADDLEAKLQDAHEKHLRVLRDAIRGLDTILDSGAPEFDWSRIPEATNLTPEEALHVLHDRAASVLGRLQEGPLTKEEAAIVADDLANLELGDWQPSESILFGKFNTANKLLMQALDNTMYAADAVAALGRKDKRLAKAANSALSQLKKRYDQITDFIRHGYVDPETGEHVMQLRSGEAIPEWDAEIPAEAPAASPKAAKSKPPNDGQAQAEEPAPKPKEGKPKQAAEPEAPAAKTKPPKTGTTQQPKKPLTADDVAETWRTKPEASTLVPENGAYPDLDLFIASVGRHLSDQGVRDFIEKSSKWAAKIKDQIANVGFNAALKSWRQQGAKALGAPDLYKENRLAEKGVSYEAFVDYLFLAGAKNAKDVPIPKWLDYSPPRPVSPESYMAIGGREPRERPPWPPRRQSPLWSEREAPVKTMPEQWFNERVRLLINMLGEVSPYLPREVALALRKKITEFEKAYRNAPAQRQLAEAHAIRQQIRKAYHIAELENTGVGTRYDHPELKPPAVRLRDATDSLRKWQEAVEEDNIRRSWPTWRKALRKVFGGSGTLAREIMGSGDLSFGGTQAAAFIIERIGKGDFASVGRLFYTMVRAGFDPQFYDRHTLAVMTRLEPGANPSGTLYDRAYQAGLRLSEPYKLRGLGQDEVFSSNLPDDTLAGFIGNLPGIRQWREASARAFAAGGNQARFNDGLYRMWESGDLSLGNLQVAREFARNLYIFTGKHPLAITQPMSRALNTIFFAARLQLAKISNVLGTGVWADFLDNSAKGRDVQKARGPLFDGWKLANTPRAQAFRVTMGMWLTFIGGAWLLKKLGADVSLDPDDPKFGAVRLGRSNRYVDLAPGGVNYIMRMLLWLGKRTYERVGGKRVAPNAGMQFGQQVGSAITGRLAPVPGAVLRAMTAKKDMRNDPTDVFAQLLYPLTFGAVLETLYDTRFVSASERAAILATSVGLETIGVRTKRIAPKPGGLPKRPAKDPLLRKLEGRIAPPTKAGVGVK